MSDVPPEIRISDVVSETDAQELREHLYEFNADATGYRDGRALSCVLRDPDGRLLAGIDGFTWSGYARIEYLWVTDGERGHGLGGALVRAAVDEARRRGCVTVIVDSHSFQAPGLYERLGFVEVGRTAQTPVGHEQVLLQLWLA